MFTKCLWTTSLDTKAQACNCLSIKQQQTVVHRFCGSYHAIAIEENIELNKSLTFCQEIASELAELTHAVGQVNAQYIVLKS